MSLFVIPDANLRQNSACSRNRLGLLGRSDIEAHPEGQYNSCSFLTESARAQPGHWQS
jgi:hypothetical protein